MPEIHDLAVSGNSQQSRGLLRCRFTIFTQVWAWAERRRGVMRRHKRKKTGVTRRFFTYKGSSWQ